MNGSFLLRHAHGRAFPVANLDASDYDSSACKVCDMAEKLTLSSSVMCDLM
jgi:hypothetical protein